MACQEEALHTIAVLSLFLSNLFPPQVYDSQFSTQSALLSDLDRSPHIHVRRQSTSIVLRHRSFQTQSRSKITMATSEKVFCKLPLLDGNVESSPQLLAVDSVSGNVAERLHELYRRDSAVFKNTLCTAWSLLLRCYAGQDCVSFRLESSGASLFQLDVQRQEPLLSCLERALTSSSIPNDDIIPQEQRTNTTVLIRYANGSVSSAVERFIADVHSYTTRVSRRRSNTRLISCLGIV